MADLSTYIHLSAVLDHVNKGTDIKHITENGYILADKTIRECKYAPSYTSFFKLNILYLGEHIISLHTDLMDL